MSGLITLKVWTHTVASLVGGKRIAGAVYLHVSALPPPATAIVEALCAHADIPYSQAVVCKFQPEDCTLSVLDYPRFFEDGFPLLRQAWTLDVRSGAVTHRTYNDDGNPPVLHRKEQMLAPTHPDVPRFSALTAQAEACGLFRDPAIIGHAAGWEEELAARGFAVDGHVLVASLPFVATHTWRAERHRTALSRTGLSSPVQALWRAGFFLGTATFFDYGCGRGDDVALLGDRGIPATGWDPWFRPEAPRRAADLVNLGFVLNVVEDLRERRAALSGAWGLTGKVLSVAALIGGRTAQDRWRLYEDGVLTSRGTFQKYFTHSELGQFIADVVGREPVAVQPGVYFAFRRDEDEQDFLEQRQRSRWSWDRRPTPTRPPRERVPRPVRTPRIREPRPDKWATHAPLIDAFWDACLEYGRIPDATEWPELPALIAHVGKPERVLAHEEDIRDATELTSARQHRMDDLLVYLALQTFERRQSFQHLSTRLQRDVRTFWNSHARAIDAGRGLLFSTGQQAAITDACVSTAESGLGWLETREDGSPDSLHLPTDAIADLPPLLRVYVGCASKLYGDLAHADVVKVHARSPKVTALTYDDFAGKDEPLLMERVKIDLRRAQIDVFGYGTEQYPAEALVGKERILGRNLALAPDATS